MKRKYKRTIRFGISVKSVPYILAGLLTALIIGSILFQQLTASLFFSRKDRLNIIFYGKNTIYYSLGKYDGVDYFISFYPDVKVSVPGGYGEYRTGALGKLILLEKKPDLLKKTFSVMTASTVDRYLHYPSQEIYYGENKVKQSDLSPPSVRDVFFADSDANFFDRIYIAYQFSRRKKNAFQEVDYQSHIGRDERFFLSREFGKRYQGYLYNSIYRQENKTVQILYNSNYKTALYLSNIMEGDGIRVVDLTEDPKISRLGERCEVIEDSERPSESSRALAGYFNCSLKKAKTVSSDIIFVMGDSETFWKIL